MTESTMTKAARDYTFSLSFWMAVYGGLIALATWAHGAEAFSPPLSFLIGASPAFPIGGMILAVMRFIEASDEYVRALTTRRFVLATGLTLFACSLWGFLETFAGIAHLPLWVVFPAFWAFFGVACVVIRDRA
jgi:hypothetical protein